MCWRGRIRSLSRTQPMRREVSKRKPMSKKIVVLVIAAAILTSVQLAEAQKAPTVRKIGFLGSAASGLILSYEVFRQSLRELGYAEGHNIAIEYRTAEGRPRLLELGNELVREKVEVIVAAGGPAARSAK